ncbi:MAG: hypothetical protein WAX89_03745 [Alphaproteobacteria bacterium]
MSQTVTLEGAGKITLTDKSFMAQGGGGRIYRHKTDVVKIFLEPERELKAGMPDKLTALRTAIGKHPSIVAPKGLVYGDRNKPIGYYMPLVSDGKTITELATNGSRTELGFGDAEALGLAEKMWQVVKHVHGCSPKIVMGDANELNWLATWDAKAFKAWAIDVDAWALGPWNSIEKMMPSIVDNHTTGYSDKTDWFAWGIVSFLLLTGIHPYKGRLQGYHPMTGWQQRMKDNASVFAKGAVATGARPMDAIPAKLMDWYRATFQEGERSQPPSPLDKSVKAAKAALITRMLVQATGGLVYEKLFEQAGNTALRIWPNGTALLANGNIIRIADGRVLHTARSLDCAVVTQPDNSILVAELIGQQPTFTLLQPTGIATKVVSQLQGEAWFATPTQLFIRQADKLTEVQLTVLGSLAYATAGISIDVLPYATKWFDGAALMDVFGKHHLLLPTGQQGLAQMAVPELDGKRVLNGFARQRLTIFTVLTKQGDYRRIELVFDKTFTRYTVVDEVVATPNLNLTMLENGTVVQMPEDGKIIASLPFAKGSSATEVEDKYLHSGMHLYNMGNKVAYVESGAIWRMQIK